METPPETNELGGLITAAPPQQGGNLSIWSAPSSLVSRSGPGLHLTGAASAYCFDIHTRRVSRTTRLSAPEHHRYVRVLDWKVSDEFAKGVYGEAAIACKCGKIQGLNLFSIVVNGVSRCAGFKGSPHMKRLNDRVEAAGRLSK